MEREYYIDHIRNNRSIYNKLEELAVIANEPITVEGLKIKYNNIDMKRDRDNYYYQIGDKTIFIYLGDYEVKLACFYLNKTEIYHVLLVPENHFYYYRYANHLLTSINATPEHLTISKSNNITTSFKGFLNDINVKPYINREKHVEYKELEFTMPKLVSEEKRIKDPYLYIPEYAITLINGNKGLKTNIEKRIFTIINEEERFKISPSLFTSDLLNHFAISNQEIGRVKEISSPVSIEDISFLLSYLRLDSTKELIDEIVNNPDNPNLTTYLYRYYDTLLHAISYFQNEDKNLFYVFEDDIKRLQLK